MNTRLAIATFLGGGLGVLASCGDTKAAETPPVPAPEKQTLGGIRNLSVTDGFYLSGQCGATDIPLLQQAGVKTVIDLRMPEEDRGFDEAAAVEAAGISYVPMPFQTGQLTDEILDGLRALLNDAGNRPILMHCGGANRVGAVWLAYRVLDQGIDEEAALAEAKAVGLRNEAMEKTALDYVRKNKGG